MTTHTKPIMSLNFCHLVDAIVALQVKHREWGIPSYKSNKRFKSQLNSSHVHSELWQISSTHVLIMLMSGSTFMEVCMTFEQFQNKYLIVSHVLYVQIWQ